MWGWVMVRGSSGGDPELLASSTRGRGLPGVGGGCTGLVPSPQPPAATGPARQRIWTPQVVLREAACGGGGVRDSRPPACVPLPSGNVDGCGNLLSCQVGLGGGVSLLRGRLLQWSWLGKETPCLVTSLMGLCGPALDGGCGRVLGVGAGGGGWGRSLLFTAGPPLPCSELLPSNPLCQLLQQLQT